MKSTKLIISLLLCLFGWSTKVAANADVIANVEAREKQTVSLFTWHFYCNPSTLNGEGERYGLQYVIGWCIAGTDDNDYAQSGFHGGQCGCYICNRDCNYHLPSTNTHLMSLRR